MVAEPKAWLFLERTRREEEVQSASGGWMGGECMERGGLLEVWTRLSRLWPRHECCALRLGSDVRDKKALLKPHWVTSSGIWKLLVNGAEAGRSVSWWAPRHWRATLNTRGIRPGRELENKSPQGHLKKNIWVKCLVKGNWMADWPVRCSGCCCGGRGKGRASGAGWGRLKQEGERNLPRKFLSGNSEKFTSWVSLLPRTITPCLCASVSPPVNGGQCDKEVRGNLVLTRGHVWFPGSVLRGRQSGGMQSSLRLGIQEPGLSVHVWPQARPLPSPALAANTR